MIDTSLAFNFADLTQGVMTVLNIPVLLMLTKPYLRVLKDYAAQKKSGKNPVFVARECGISNADYWSEADRQEVQALVD